MDEGANIAEIFSSIQGEGLLVGSRQIFVRFFPCNILCNYCDTPARKSDIKDCCIEKTPGRGDFERLSNPVDVATLNEIIYALKGAKGLHHSISLTGGEPLLQVDFLRSWLPVIKKRFRIYLETNGTLFEELKSVIDSIDIIAMDIKLPNTSGIEEQWENHYWFLKAAKAKRVFVKIVVSDDTTPGEFIKAAEMVAKQSREIPIVIQPVTPTENSGKAIGHEKLINLHKIATDFVDQVRVIPQSHKMMGLL